MRLPEWHSPRQALNPYTSSLMRLKQEQLYQPCGLRFTKEYAPENHGNVRAVTEVPGAPAAIVVELLFSRTFRPLA